MQNYTSAILVNADETLVDGLSASALSGITNSPILLTKKDIQYIVITGGLTEIKSFKNLVYEILGKDVIIYLMDEIGIRDNKYVTAMGMIKYFVNKMALRGKDYSMVSQEDEELLLTPDDKKRKEKVVVTKIFKGFIRNKEEKYESRCISG